MADPGEDIFMDVVTALCFKTPVKSAGFLSNLVSMGGRAMGTIKNGKQSVSGFGWKEYAIGVIGLGAAYGAYRVIDHYSVLDPIRKTYNTLRVMCGGAPKVVDNTVMISNRRTAFESVRAGSTESAMPSPKNRGLVGELNAGEFHTVGCAIRMGMWLIMPAHVYAAVSKPYVKGRQSLLDISEYEFVELDTDLIGIKMSNKDLSVIGLADVGCYLDIPKQGAFCSIVGSAGLGTVGVVRLDHTVFGRVTYSGTTVAGYSGAPYMSGTSLIGVHTSGGAVNGGYAAGYIKTLLQIIDKEKPESSEDWLQRVYDRDEEIRIDPKWQGLDEIRIQVGGKFAIVDRQSMSRAFGKHWENDIDDGYFVKSKRSFMDEDYGVNPYADHECKPSGEVKTSDSGVSRLSKESPDLEDRVLNKLMAELSKLSVKQRKAVLGLLPSRKDLSTPPPTQAKGLIENSKV